ncbi:MAG: NUDIX domain-containing protein [Oscillospiraceae bacterium]|nr:NUDIX domain-containing protein [Oscillospiraceae bacterium]
METDASTAAIRLQTLLGKYVRVHVVKPMGTAFPQGGEDAEYELNYGELVTFLPGAIRPEGVYVVGIHHPVRNFDGRVIALLHAKDGKTYAVAAPKKSRYIIGQIRRAVAFAFPPGSCRFTCLYERSCGALVFRRAQEDIRFLLIKNRRSAHWGFPKGHVEDGESAEQTARREVLEETGLHIRILPGFSCQSEYVIQSKVEKSVTIFLAETTDKRTLIQEDEIEDYIWLNYTKAMQSLRFENDRSILRKAHSFLRRAGLMNQKPPGGSANTP